MTSTVDDDLDLRDLAPADVLSFAADQRRTADRAEARLLAAAVQWVDLHPVTEARLAGVGTPGISEYAVEALAATLGVSYGAGLRLVSEAVELCFRLPRLWSLVQGGRLQAWKARAVAAETMELSGEAVGFVDRHLAVIARKNTTPSPGKLKDLLHEAMLRCDPDQAAGVEQAALDARGVWFDHRASTATTDVTARLDTLDALDLEASVESSPVCSDGWGMAARSTSGRPPRSACSLTRNAPWTSPAPTGEPTRSVVNGSKGTLVPARHHRGPRRRRGGGRVEKLGPATLDLLRDWITRFSSFTVRPVLDLARTDAVDAHDPPAWMREGVIQRDAHCVFPGCGIGARSCDLDHVGPTSRWTKAGHRGRRLPRTSPVSARRHPPAQDLHQLDATDGSPTGTTRGPTRTATRTP